MTETMPYVEDIEYRTTADGAYENDWVILHCTYGDTYNAFYEDQEWWLDFCPGDPSEGPFASVDDVVEWLNSED